MNNEKLEHLKEALDCLNTAISYANLAALELRNSGCSVPIVEGTISLAVNARDIIAAMIKCEQIEGAL